MAETRLCCIILPMDFGSSSIAFLIGVALVFFYMRSRPRWDQQTEQALVEQATGDDWRAWKPALQELQRRGVAIDAHVPRLAARLLSDSMLQRESARMALAELIPGWQQQLAACGYASSDAPAVAHIKLQPVFAHFGLASPAP